MNPHNRFQISVKTVLLMLLVFACFFGVWRALQQVGYYRAEVDRLSKSAYIAESRVHPNARLEVVRSGKTLSSPEFLTGTGQWFGGNLTATDPAGNAQNLSYKGRYVYSTARDDIYLFLWSSESRLPPVPGLKKLDGQYALVSIEEGDNSVMKNEFWEIRVVVPRRTNK